MMFSVMLQDAFQDGDNGIPIRYRFDGKLFNQSSSLLMTWQRVLQQKRKCKKGVDQVSDSCDSYDLTISIKKTEVVYQPAPGKPYKEPTVTMKG